MSTAENNSRHIIQLEPDVSFCAGCCGCEIVCALVHEGVSSPSYRRIYVQKDTHQLEHKIFTCQHCEDHPCYNACPKKGEAMLLDEEKNIAYVNAEGCIGCGLCVKACPYEPKRIHMAGGKKPKERKAVKCDLCRTRPEGPACIEECQVRCIQMNDRPIPEAPPKAACWDEQK